MVLKTRICAVFSQSRKWNWSCRLNCKGSRYNVSLLTGCSMLHRSVCQQNVLFGGQTWGGSWHTMSDTWQKVKPRKGCLLSICWAVGYGFSFPDRGWPDHLQAAAKKRLQGRVMVIDLLFQVFCVSSMFGTLCTTPPHHSLQPLVAIL